MDGSKKAVTEMCLKNAGNCLKHPEVSKSNFSDKEIMLNL